MSGIYKIKDVFRVRKWGVAEVIYFYLLQTPAFSAMIDGMLHPSAPPLIRPFTLDRWLSYFYFSDNNTRHTLKRHDEWNACWCTTPDGGLGHFHVMTSLDAGVASLLCLTDSTMHPRPAESATTALTWTQFAAHLYHRSSLGMICNALISACPRVRLQGPQQSGP